MAHTQNTGKQVGPQNKDFCTVSQTDLTRKFSSICSTGYLSKYLKESQHCLIIREVCSLYSLTSADWVTVLSEENKHAKVGQHDI